ncbi:outer membrane phospholipase A [Sphingomonas zeicaulis]|uniref:phospholipase A n=1 Tax=Sphingomonas zeicaulis TaxID=1632740 RepID=UPI003D1EAFBC
MIRPFPAVAAIAVAVIATPAWAGAEVEILLSRADQRDAAGHVLIDVRLLNSGATPQTIALPVRMEARLESADGTRSVWIERATQATTSITIPPQGFVPVRYRLAEAAGEGGRLSVPGWSVQEVALAPDGPAPAVAEPQRQANASSPLPTPPAADRTVGNAFVGNLSAYEPIYAVYGPGTNTEARIQFSFKYQLFGSQAREDRHASLRDGLYFAYTQRMFWDLGADSLPFRNIDYQPEIFYLSPPVAGRNVATLSAQIGARHESNGRAGLASRSVNTVYVAPMAAFSLGGDRRLTVAPRVWLYAGSLSDNPDIRRYRGNSSLFVEIGDADGVRLSTTSRLNFGSGKGAVTADISYPLRRIVGGGPDFYLFGQTFFGYGENLLDYDKRTTRIRVGVALVR